MTEKQKRFADEYLIDCNGTQAAIRAGYSKNSAGGYASRIMRIPEVRAYIDARLEEIHNEKTADAKEIIEYLTSVMRGESISEVVVVENIGDHTSEARRFEKQPDEKERLKAAELLGKRYGLFTNRSDTEGVFRVVFSGEEKLNE